ncbi:hypothetical protein STSV1pORF70 [Sulfolobus virus STSV1]|uniref:hypothetical protein n=1 Tax=Sulfolobus virus STSV1 TaxID=285013 RepID=UPI000042B134|nr:hypothetical protein STSV1pORF70 [Sulfolobus virus STSV1]CAH04253.1 hypothetical protein [Sulfolobus virus STSV1]
MIKIGKYLIEKEGEFLKITNSESENELDLNTVTLYSFEVKKIENLGDDGIIYYYDGRKKRISELFQTSF